MIYYLYKIINLINNKFYIGVHSTYNINDGYMGSGKLLKKAIKAYGIQNFKKEILEYFNSPEEMYSREYEIVNDELINDNMCYNLTYGGKGNSKNMCWVEDYNLNRIKVHKNDKRIGKSFFKCSCFIDASTTENKIIYFTSQINPDVKSGKLIPISKNKVVVKDNNGNTLKVSTSDPRYLSGELVGANVNKLVVYDCNACKWIRINKSDFNKNTHKTNFTNRKIVMNETGDSMFIPVGEQPPTGYKSAMSGKVVTKDNNNNIKVVSTSDPRYLSGELKHICKHKINVIDEYGTIHHVNKTHPNVISGVWKFMHTGKTAVRDKYGNTFVCDINDPKFKSGEYVSVHKNKVVVKDNNGNTLKVSTSDPRYLSGELKHVGFEKNIATMKDEHGNYIRIHKDKIHNTNLVGTTKGRVSIRNIHTGEFICVSVNDPRTKSPDYKYTSQDKIAMYHLDTHKKILIECDEIPDMYKCGYRFKFSAYKMNSKDYSTSFKTLLENDTLFDNGWKIQTNFLNKPKFDLMRKYNIPFPPPHMFTKSISYENIVKGIY